MRRATESLEIQGEETVFQSTLSMRRATIQIFSQMACNIISIHALHEESDMAITFTQWIDQTFQSTLSMRRATLHNLLTRNAP